MDITNEIIYCACGCGGTLERYWYDNAFSHRKERKYIHGHNSINKRVDGGCAQCGKNITIPSYKIGKSKVYFCSLKCNGAYKKNTREEIKCKGCGVLFYVIPARKDKAQYCTKQCRLQYESVTRPCSQCGKSVTRNRATMLQKRVYCSRECQHLYQSINLRRENHPLWKNAPKRNMGVNWNSQRKRALERDNHSCQHCGKRSGLDVHHIVPARIFLLPELSNVLRNLITLCNSCHPKADAEARKQYPYK